MSADNNETKPSVISTGEAETPQRDNAQTLLIVLVVLALVASVVMLFTGSIGALKIALLAALWAAVIGIILVFRYRNQVESTRAELSNERAQHDLEMKEAKARYDADQAQMERDITERVTQKIRTEESETLSEIREQLEQMRSQLEYLTGHSYVEPSMIHAQARRIPEIESEQKKPEPTPAQPETVTPEPEPVKPAVKVDDSAPIFGASTPTAQPKNPQNYATPAGAVKDSLKKATRTQAVEETRSFGRIDVEAPEPVAGGRRRKENKTFDTNTFEKVQWVQGGTGKRSTGEQAGATYVGKRSAEARAEADANHGKRRRDEHTQAISVADLLKRNKKDK